MLQIRNELFFTAQNAHTGSFAVLPYKQRLFRETKKKYKCASTLPVNHSHMRLNLHPGRLMRKQQSHWLVLSSYRPCFDFSKSVQANADNVINIHESSSLFVLSAFYVVLSIIHSMIINLSVLLIGFPAVFYRKWKWHDIQPNMVTHTWNSSSAFTLPKCTHSSEHTHTHTHTANTHPEQWAVIYAVWMNKWLLNTEWPKKAPSPVLSSVKMTNMHSHMVTKF